MTTAAFDDCQLASLVTFCVIELESAAVAVNCDVAPTAGVEPLNDTERTVGPATVIRLDPVTVWYVARTSASPAATPVTTPVEDTVATAAFDDCHVAWLVTFCVVPFDRLAVAVNCAVAPTAGADPVTATDETVGDADGEGAVGCEDVEVPPLPPHAHSSVPNNTAPPKPNA